MQFLQLRTTTQSNRKPESIGQRRKMFKLIQSTTPLPIRNGEGREGPEKGMAELLETKNKNKLLKS